MEVNTYSGRSEPASRVSGFALAPNAGAGYDIRSACYLGDVERVRALAADPRQVRDKHALRIAAGYGRESLVKLLLEREEAGLSF